MRLRAGAWQILCNAPERCGDACVRPHHLGRRRALYNWVVRQLPGGADLGVPFRTALSAWETITVHRTAIERHNEYHINIMRRAAESAGLPACPLLEYLTLH